MFQQHDNARTRVKICGLTTLEDARYASGAMADYLGFIFVPGSKRYVNPDQAAAIIAWIEGPEAVGVFMNQPLDDVIDIVNKTGVRLVQLHGQESVEYCSLMPVPVIKSISVDFDDTTDSLTEKMRPYEGVVNYFLFDTSKDGQSGGTGYTFDWDILLNLYTETPWFVAGGIGPDNVGAVVKKLQPFGVDANSKLESEPGTKQLEKFEMFFDEIRAIWKNQDPE
jgi:phosphoribosylanthranilate isomerase